LNCSTKEFNSSKAKLRAKAQFEKNVFSRKDYMELFKSISSATGSKVLKDGLTQRIFNKVVEKRQTKYVFGSISFY